MYKIIKKYAQQSFTRSRKATMQFGQLCKPMRLCPTKEHLLFLSREPVVHNQYLSLPWIEWNENPLKWWGARKIEDYLKSMVV